MRGKKSIQWEMYLVWKRQDLVWVPPNEYKKADMTVEDYKPFYSQCQEINVLIPTAHQSCGVTKWPLSCSAKDSDKKLR